MSHKSLQVMEENNKDENVHREKKEKKREKKFRGNYDILLGIQIMLFC